MRTIPTLLAESRISTATRTGVIGLAMAFILAIEPLARTAEQPWQSALARTGGYVLVAVSLIGALGARGRAVHLGGGAIELHQLAAPVRRGSTTAIPLTQIAGVQVTRAATGDSERAPGAKFRFHVELSVSGTRRLVRTMTFRNREEADLLAERIRSAIGRPSGFPTGS